MRLQNRTLNAKNRLAVVNFVREIFEIDNVTITVIADDDDKKKFHDIMNSLKIIHN